MKKFAILAIAFLMQFSEYISAQQYAMVPVQTTGINGPAVQEQQALTRSANMNMMIGFMLMQTCSTSKPTNMMMCMLGALTLVQGISDKKAADQAVLTNNQVSLVPMPVAATGPTTIVTGQTFPPSTVAGLNILSKAGYTVTTLGVTSPKGEPVSVPDLNSSTGLANFGFDKKSIDHIQKTVETAQRSIASTGPSN